MTSSLFQHCGKAPFKSSFRIILPVFLSQMGNSPLGWGVYTCIPLFCLEGGWFCFLFGLLPTFCFTFSQYKDQMWESSSRTEIRWIFASTSAYWLITQTAITFLDQEKKNPTNQPSKNLSQKGGCLSFSEKQIGLSLFHYGQAIFNPVGRKFPLYL